MDQNIMRLRVETVRGNLEGVKSALATGVPVDQLFKTGQWNALMHASSLGHHDIVEHLLKEGADPNFHKDLFTSLMAACASNVDNETKLLRCVQHLICYKADVNAMERHHITPLMFACKQGHGQIVQYLIDNHVDLNAHDSQGWTALFWAVSKEKLEIVEMLIRAGANRDEKDRCGGTALLLATRKSFHVIAEVLRFGVRKLTSDIHSVNSDCPVVDGDNNNINDVTYFRESQNNTNDFNKTDFASYLTFTDEEFKKLSTNLYFQRKDTLSLIKDFQNQPWNSSVGTDQISYVTAVKIMAEFATQIGNMHATMAFIRYRFQNFPLDQPRDNRLESASRFRYIAGLLLCKSEHLYMETKFLNEYLTKLDEDERVPSEVKNEENVPTEGITKAKSTVTTVIVASACLIIVILKTKTVYWPFSSLTLF